MNRPFSLCLSTLVATALTSSAAGQTYNFAEYWPIAPGYSWKAVAPSCVDPCACATIDLWDVLGPDPIGPNAYRVGPGSSFSYVIEDTGSDWIFHGYYFGTNFTPISPSGPQHMGAIPDGFSFVVDSSTVLMFRDWNAITSPNKALYPIPPGLPDVGVWLWYDTAFTGTGNSHHEVLESGVPAGTMLPAGSVTDVEFFVKGQGMYAYMDVEAGPPNTGAPWPPVLDYVWFASLDCNLNGVVDHLDISSETSADLDLDCIPDECAPGVAGDSYCEGDGTDVTCPCFAFGNPGAGCANTSGFGATLTGLGWPSFANDTFRLDIVDVPGSKPGLVLRGDDQVALPAGDGVLCTSGQSQRSQVQVTVAGATTFTDFNGVGFGATANAGAPTRYQFWYRDPDNNCSGSGFNFSNAWTVTWAP